MRTKFEHICACPDKVTAPGSINDDGFEASVIQIPKGVHRLFAQAAKTCQTGMIRITSGNEDGISLELVDVAGGDILTYQLRKEPVAARCGNRYRLATVRTLLKVDPEPTLAIGAKGVIKINIRGLDVFILPIA